MFSVALICLKVTAVSLFPYLPLSKRPFRCIMLFVRFLKQMFSPYKGSLFPRCLSAFSNLIMLIEIVFCQVGHCIM